MSNESIRIRTTPNDGSKTVNFQLNQKFDFIEILSLKISQEDAYRRFCSDYGVVIGRVTVNSGFGVPNAKVSIFIPISEEDKSDPLISGLYPHSAINDKNAGGYRYNLLPKTNETSNDCFTETGSFFNKREFQDNDVALDIYCKYYKYTTVTNAAGDYMLFGVPNGNYLIHVDADISNIGVVSQKPYDLAREGSNDNQFYSSSKFKKSENLDTLTQIKSSNGSVNVVPFWGDTEQCNIGITRFDVDLATNVSPCAIFIGSLFGDNNKNSVNKRCRPTKKVGTLAGMTTGSGTIEMIRKTILGEVERFDIDGGELIDDDGIWSYQIPMNLDYVVTDEFGNLIPTDDPNKGIPTRARLRFKIGMNATGGEGRLRTRAKYLVPHNPTSWVDSDYNFDETTKDKNFQDFYWNKIYTVANHITRVQSTVLGGATMHRTFTGLKEVDDSGSNNPFPFNKMDTTLNPLFVILCVIVNIIAIIIKMLNNYLIPALNAVFYALNKYILEPICKILNSLSRMVCKLRYSYYPKKVVKCIEENSHKICTIDYISYILLSCTADETGKPYCIGCDKSKTSNNYVGNGHYESWYKTIEDTPPGFIYPGSTTFNAWEDTSPKGDAGWTNCIALALADALDAFKFDFFNDWVNGSLYSYLLKYKVTRKGNGKEKFCEIDCGSPDGVDNNKDKEPDNDCNTNYIVDSCFSAVPQGTDTTGSGVGESSYHLEVKEGLIKKYKGDLYYAAFSKKVNYRLYATKIVCLGAVFECDWQGLPKIHQYLVDTTYNRPPLTNIYHDSGSYKNEVMESGFDSPNNKLSDSQICNINCTSLSVGSQQCNNIKRLSELGVNSDGDNRDNGGEKADFKITNDDVSNSFIRGMLAYVNGTYDPVLSNKIQLIPFDVNTEYKYDHKYYDKFRGIRSKSDPIWMYENSFYFYFGLLPGKTAITKLKTKYFPDCIRTERKEMSIVIKDITDDSIDGKGIGSITATVIGGIEPFIYEWEGPLINGKRISCCYNGNTKAPCNGSTLSCVEGTPFSNLYGGTYTLTVSDSAGNVVTTTVTIGGFVGVECEVQSTPTNSTGNGNVYITLSHGTSPYNITIQQLDANEIPIPSKIYKLPPVYQTDIGGTCYGGCTKQPLPEGNYIMTVTDSGTKLKTECNSSFIILKPETLLIDVTHTSTPKITTPNIIPKLSCNGNNNGTAYVSVEGGTPPYKCEFKLMSTSNNLWTNLINTVVNTSISSNNLVAGTYELTVTDLGGNTAIKTFTIQEPPAITINLIKVLNVSAIDGDNGVAIFKIYGSNPPFKVELDGPSSINKTVNDSGVVTEFTNLLAEGTLNNDKTVTYKPYKVTVTDVSGCTNTFFTNQLGQITDNFTITQDENLTGPFYLSFDNYSPKVVNFDKINGESRYCITKVDTLAYNNIPVLRHKIIIYNRNGIGLKDNEYLYHVRIDNGSPDKDNIRYLIGNPNLNVEKFKYISNGQGGTIKVSLGVIQNAKPYTSGWVKLTDSNSQVSLDKLGRVFYVYSALKKGSGNFQEKIQDIVVEISDNAQKDTFNVVKVKMHYDLDTFLFDGDTVGNFANLDSTTGIYCYYNSTNNGMLIGEAGYTITESQDSPFQ
jgi:hypothetical protein